jgi:transposase
MAEGNADPVRLLGLSGFVVLDVSEVAGELELVVETDATVVGCHGCGVRAVSHGRRSTLVRDLPVSGRPTRLRWRKRLWRCHEPLCPTGTWTERHPAVAPRAALTERAREEVCRRVGEDAVAVAKVARDFGVGWQTAMRAVIDRGQRRIDDSARLAGVTSLGLDETAFLRPARDRGSVYVTGMVDVVSGRLLDVVAGRTAAAVREWLDDRDAGWLAGISEVTIDPYAGYKTAVAGGDGRLRHATLIADHFHLIRLANACVDQVRRRVQRDLTGHRGRAEDPLYRVRRLLVRAADRLTPRQWQRLEAAWVVADLHDEVYLAWATKEALRDVYRSHDPHDARAALDVFYRWAADSGIGECQRLARTVRRWETELLAWHTSGGLTNARTEAVNLLIKKIKRVGHGFRNFDNYRIRLLLHCGVDWHTAPAARIRGRAPRSVA